MPSPTVKTNTKDPFLISLRNNARSHFTACGVAFLVLCASRYSGLRAAGPDAILLTPSPVGLIADFLTAVLMLTFFRVLYSIPLLFVRPAVRNVGVYVLFTLVFGVVFTLRKEQALGVRVEQAGLRVFYSYPTASVVIPFGDLSRPRLRETSAVSIVDIPDSSVHFVPAFRFDATGQASLRSVFNVLTTAATADR